MALGTVGTSGKINIFFVISLSEYLKIKGADTI